MAESAVNVKNPGDPASTPFRMSSIGRHGFVYGLGILLNKAVAFIMLPIYTRYLTPSDYGVLQLIDMTLEVVSIFAGSRLALGIFRFYHKVDDPLQKRAVLSTALILLCTTYSAAALATVLTSGSISGLVFGSPENADLVRIAGLSLGFQSLVIVPLAYIQVRERSSIFITINAIKLLVQLSLNILLVVYLGMAAKGVLLSTLIANMVVGAFLAAYLVRDVGLRFSPSAARDQLRFGIPFIGTQIATFFLTFGDRYFLLSAADTATVGIYALAYQFGFLLSAIGLQPFSQVWDPKRFEIAKRSDRNEIYARGFVYLNLLLLTMATGLALFVSDLLRIMSDPEFWPAARLVPFVLVAYVLYAWSKFLDVGILVRERTEYITLANWAAAAVILVCYVLLIPPLLGVGAALATIIAFAVRVAMVYSTSQKLWPVRYDWTPVLRLCTLALLIWTAGYLLPELRLWIAVPIRVALFGVYALGIWYFGILTPGDKAFLKRFVRSPGAAVRAFFARPGVSA